MGIPDCVSKSICLDLPRRPSTNCAIVTVGSCFSRASRSLCCERWRLMPGHFCRKALVSGFTLMWIPTVCYEIHWMAILEILKYPDVALKQTSLPVKNIDGAIAQLVNDLLDTMYAAPGVGLAAPQVGARQRIIVLDIEHDNPGKT